jgi:hypothetical protein
MTYHDIPVSQPSSKAIPPILAIQQHRRNLQSSTKLSHGVALKGAIPIAASSK